MTAGTVTPRGRHHRKSGLVVPEPPDDREKASYAWRSLPVLAAAIALSSLCLIVSQVWLEISQPILAIFSWYTLVFLAGQAVQVPVNVAARSFDLAAHVRRIGAWQPASYPDVDIYLPICGEPIDVLRNTWTGVFELVHAYPGCARAYVLDDGPSDVARDVSGAFGFTYLRRPESRQSGKAGNLNHAFGRTASPVLVVLDADVRPRGDFLAETLPYLDDPTVGIVQTPRLFRASSQRTWVERAARPVLEVFGRSAQVSRDRFSAALCAGSNAVYRRAALTAAGGFALTPAGGDAHTGLDARYNGYRPRYLPLPLAAGVGPLTLEAFVRLQYRWCCEATSLVWTPKLWRVPMSRSGRLPYLANWASNLMTGLSTLTLPLIPVVILTLLPGDIRPGNALLLVPALLSWIVLYPLWHNSPYRPRSWPLSLAAGWAQVLASWDYARGRNCPGARRAVRRSAGCGGGSPAGTAGSGWRGSPSPPGESSRPVRGGSLWSP